MWPFMTLSSTRENCTKHRNTNTTYMNLCPVWLRVRRNHTRWWAQHKESEPPKASPSHSQALCIRTTRSDHKNLVYIDQPHRILYFCYVMTESILVSKKSAKAEEMVNRMNTSPIFDCTVFVHISWKE